MTAELLVHSVNYICELRSKTNFLNMILVLNCDYEY